PAWRRLPSSGVGARQPQAECYASKHCGGNVESVPMSETVADTPEPVVKFESKARPRTDDTPLEEIGHAIVAKIQGAAELANENCDRAMTLAHKLSMELRAAEDRIIPSR